MTRKKQRKIAFQLIFSLNFQGTDACTHVIEEYYALQEEPEQIPFLEDTVKGVCDHWDQINGMIEPALSNRKFNRVTPICMSVLRLATYELKFSRQTPEAIIFNEAIELAKEFGDSDSAAFVHGVLSAIAKKE